MTWHHPTARDFDRAHDERKHYPRPTDGPITARTVAVRARASTTTLENAALLIQAFADATAAAAAEKAVENYRRSVNDTLGVLLESPLKIGASA